MLLTYSALSFTNGMESKIKSTKIMIDLVVNLPKSPTVKYNSVILPYI